MALAGKRTAAAGGADATVTTAAGLWAVIDSLLTTAGWTQDFDYTAGPPANWVASIVLPPVPSVYTVGQLVTSSSNIYQCITSGTASTTTGPSGEGNDITDGTVHWRFITSSAGKAMVYKSTGESGNEIMWCRVVANTNATAAINIRNYQYFDAATTKFGFNPNDFAGTTSPNFHQYTYTAGNVTNFAMVADKDSWFVMTNDSANARRLFGGGRLNRAPGTIATFFASNATVTAGLNKTITVAAGNPVAAGYAIGDRVFVVAQEANNVSPHNMVIPLYAAVITAVTTTTITIDNAQATTAAGALIGADPQPLFIPSSTTNTDLSNTGSAIGVAYIWDNTVPNLWNAAASTGQGYLNLSTTELGLIGTAAAEVDPSRSGRVAIGEVLIASSTNEIAGILPKYYSNPRTTDTLWNIARTTKEATPRDYVLFPANTATPAGTRRSQIGPFAVSGSATFNADLYTQDSNTWVEAFLNVLTDKSHRSTIHHSGAQMIVGDSTSPPGFIGQTFPDSDAGTSPNAIAFNDVMPQGVLQVNTVADKTIEGQGSPLRTGGEIYPFDTSNTTQGGSGSSFNSGFN